MGIWRRVSINRSKSRKRRVDSTMCICIERLGISPDYRMDSQGLGQAQRIVAGIRVIQDRYNMYFLEQ